jgi:diphosphomevalonate decarboxylase
MLETSEITRVKVRLLRIMKSVTVRAPINIAVIKYWGKSDEQLIIPCNDSISMTLDSPELNTQTTITADPQLEEDEFCLEGHPEVSINKRIRKSIETAREFASKLPENREILTWKLRIMSRNSVPTASGLASSASGIAALSYALIKLYNLDSVFSLSQLSCIARLGSGSACRSLFGGMVHWHGESVKKVGEWDGLNGFVVVFNMERKKIPSTIGMQTTTQTSSLFQHRITSVAPQRVTHMLEAIKQHDFQVFAEIAMKDSNSFHACCLDTFPPILYLTPESMEIISAVHEFNDKVGRAAVGYTFDAGPNAVIFGLGSDPETFLNQLKMTYLTAIPWKLGQGPQIL